MKSLSIIGWLIAIGSVLFMYCLGTFVFVGYSLGINWQDVPDKAWIGPAMICGGLATILSVFLIFFSYAKRK